MKFKMNRKVFNIIGIVVIMFCTSVATVFAERIIASSVVTYNNSTSGLKSTNVQGALDELYTKCSSGGDTLADTIKNLAASDTVIADDGTADHNMRYTGKNPNNYVTFAGELWRIIGVFNNVDNGTGKKETRIKIIRAESLGNKQWHTSNVNVWKTASLNAELQATSYASNSMVENAVWYLRDNGSSHTASASYVNEREGSLASGNDATWTGKVGLMYPSDYGFASSACKDGSKTLSSYNDATCTGSNWLYLGSLEWLLPPFYNDTTSARFVYSLGHTAAYAASNSYAVRPAVYLKSSVTCKNCSDSSAGTQSKPFQLG